MIAKVQWFARRKYSGWGLTPKSWQGIAYIMAIAAIFAAIQNSPLQETIKIALSGIWLVFILVDTLQVMTKIKMDELEQRIEAISERNASWTMVATIIMSLLYISTLGKDLKGLDLAPVLVLPVLTGAIAKGVTGFILDRRGV